MDMILKNETLTVTCSAEQVSPLLVWLRRAGYSIADMRLHSSTDNVSIKATRSSQVDLETLLKELP